MKNVLFLSLLFAFIISGCSGVQTKKGSNKTQAYKQYNFETGKTTKAEIIAKLGKPTGVETNFAGEEILTYNRSHVTGKAFIPFYFGRDKYRVIFIKYKFNKDGVLMGISKNEQHY